MAVATENKAITEFDQWYLNRKADSRTGGLEIGVTHAPVATHMWSMFEDYRREHRSRVANYYKLEKLVNGEVVTTKKDLPNISSGETAGIVRRMARNLVQNAPNLEVVSKFDDASAEGVFSRYVLLAKIVGTDLYSNDMQQNIFASTKMALTVGFDCVIPLLTQDAAGSWLIKYDSVGYQDVFPEPGARDIRQATNIFVRRYLTKGEVKSLIEMHVDGWDELALIDLVKTDPPAQQQESVAAENRKHHTVPDGYEVITWYSNSGDAFLTFSATTKHLLRIEKNKHPLKEHPVHFLVLEKDSQQPLGKSQVELLLGRQEFQDLMLNGAMKMWYRNINPAIIGYGAVNSIPNLSPGKYTEISNPNAKVEAFEVNTQTLLQHGQISQQNAGAMVQMVGAADQQMAAQSAGPTGMSATPQGVDAQQKMVDITSNNYQKAIESFVSHYCSYSLTIYFAELKTAKQVILSADARGKLINGGIDPSRIQEDGTVDIKFADLATEYYVRAVPGSLVELEDEKQMRMLQELFVPLSQAMPALAASQDQDALTHASQAMQFIVETLIKLSGSAHSALLTDIFTSGETPEVAAQREKESAMDNRLGGFSTSLMDMQDAQDMNQANLNRKVDTLSETVGLLLEKLGVTNGPSAENQNTSEEGQLPQEQPSAIV